MKNNTQASTILHATLTTMVDTKSDTLQQAVINEALSYDTDAEIESFFRDLAQYGCVSGMVSNLIWYTQTHAFYDKYYDDIEALRVEYLENVGEALNV